MGITNHSGRADRMRLVLDHYLDLARALREGAGSVAIWPCPECTNPSFVASFEEGVAGCSEVGCSLPASMDLLELICYLDENLVPGDRRFAGEKVGEILEETVKREQEREDEEKERRRKAREDRRWQKGLTRARVKKEGWPEQSLFD